MLLVLSEYAPSMRKQTLALQACRQMGIKADITQVLWHHGHLQTNPRKPQWLNRGRFIHGNFIVNGQAAMLQCALLHSSGFDLCQQ